MATYTYPNTSGIIDLTPATLAGLSITLNPGDILNINSGTFDSIKMTGLNGASGNPITINFGASASFFRSAYTTEMEMVNSSYLVFNGQKVTQYTNAVFCSMWGTTHDITWRNGSYKNFTHQHAFEIGNVSHPKNFTASGLKSATYYNIIWDNCVFDGIGYGSFINQKDGISLDCEVKNCQFKNVIAPGSANYPYPIYFWGFGWKIHDNTFNKIGNVNVHLACIQYYGYADIYKNVFSEQLANDVRCFPLYLSVLGYNGKNRFWNNISHDKLKYSMFEFNTNNQNDKETDPSGYYVYNPNNEVYFNTLIRSKADDFHAYIVDFYGASGTVRGNIILAPEIDKTYNGATNYRVYNQAGTYHTSTVTQSENYQQQTVFPVNFNDVTFTPVLGGNLLDNMTLDVAYITTDFYGNPRKYGTFSDAGAVEYQGVPVIVVPINNPNALRISRDANTSVIGSFTPNVKTLTWNPKETVIKFFAQGIPPLTVTYNNLIIDGEQVINRKDAILKLNKLFPDSAGNLSETDDYVLETSTTTRYYGHHTVLSLLHQNAPGGPGMSIQDWLQLQKDSGYNVIWAHCDDYDPANAYYKTNLLALLDAAEAIGGIWISPGLMNWGDTGANTATKKAKNMITDTWDREGVFKMDGKPVYMGYNYFADSVAPNTFNQIDLDDLLLIEEGIHKQDWILIANSQYPISFDVNRVVWEGEVTGANGVKRWDIGGVSDVKPGVAPYYYISDLQHLLDEWPWVEGFIPFSVDMDTDRIIKDNLYRSRIGKRRKLAGGGWGGWSAFYASSSYRDFGFEGTASIWQAVIDQKVDDRPIGMLGATGNDDIEYSRIAPMSGFVDGLRYVPEPGVLIGVGVNTIPTPILDRAGLTSFIKPWADAFLTNSNHVSFLSNEIFCWYMLHPKGASLIPTIPAGAVAQGYNQGQWDTMLYSTGSARITGIQGITDVDNIQMAAHLTGPAGTQYYLKINSTLSSIITVPSDFGTVAYFEIPLSTFTGIPVFSIIAADGTTVIKTGNGPQAITNSAWPGGWGTLVVKL